LIGECRRLGVEVRPPDINRSDVDYAIEATKPGPSAENPLLNADELAIRFGLGAIKNVGDGPAQIIIEARGDKPFADIDDFAQRVDLRQVNKRVLECLIMAGAFDSLGERAALQMVIDRMMSVSQEMHRAREIGQRSLFDLSPEVMGGNTGARLTLPGDVAPLPQKRCLTDEKELLGVYMSAHPLDLLSKYVDERVVSLADIEESLVGEQIKVAGVVNSAREITTKKGDGMAFAQFEDLSGAMELVVFPRVYSQTQSLLRDDAVVMVEAKVDLRDESLKLIAETIEPYTPPSNAPLRQRQAKRPKQLVIEISLGRDSNRDADVAQRVFGILSASRGEVPFSFCFDTPSGRLEMDFPEISTTYSPQVERQVIDLVGRDHFTVVWA
jgi:DNA polymerase-3 subunit alpha